MVVVRHHRVLAIVGRARKIWPFRAAAAGVVVPGMFEPERVPDLVHYRQICVVTGGRIHLGDVHEDIAADRSPVGSLVRIEREPGHAGIQVGVQEHDLRARCRRDLREVYVRDFGNRLDDRRDRRALRRIEALERVDEIADFGICRVVAVDVGRVAERVVVARNACRHAIGDGSARPEAAVVPVVGSRLVQDRVDIGRYAAESLRTGRSVVQQFGPGGGVRRRGGHRGKKSRRAVVVDTQRCGCLAVRAGRSVRQGNRHRLFVTVEVSSVIISVRAA